MTEDTQTLIAIPPSRKNGRWVVNSNSTGQRGSGTGREILLVLSPGLPEVHVHVNQSWKAQGGHKKKGHLLGESPSWCPVPFFGCILCLVPTLLHLVEKAAAL